MDGNVGSMLPEGPLIVFSPHIFILFALIVTLLVYIVSRKKPSLTRFSISICYGMGALCRLLFLRFLHSPRLHIFG
jgi:hypothetical protein